MIGKEQKLSRTSQQREFVRTSCEKKFLRKVTAVGFKRAKNSRGNFFKCITGCDVREKNHLGELLTVTDWYLGVCRSAFGRGNILSGP